MHAGVTAKAIILLPIGGVTLLDETQNPIEPGALTWKRDIRIAMAGPAGQFGHRICVGKHSAGRGTADPTLGQTLRSVRQSSAQSGVGQSFSGFIQSAAGLSHGRRPRAARSVQPPHGPGSSHAARCHHRAGIRDAVHASWHDMEHLADHDRILPLRGCATGRTLGGVSISSRNSSARRYHADRFRHAIFSRHAGRCARQSRPFTCRTIFP